jgi:hypothetical protein
MERVNEHRGSYAKAQEVKAVEEEKVQVAKQTVEEKKA